MSFYIGVDLAISERERADYSVFVVCGIDSEGVLYIMDVLRDRIDGREIIDTLFSLEKRYKPEFIAIEKEKISKAIGPFLYEEMPKRGLYPNIIEITPSKDLLTRARSMQGRMRSGFVKFNKKAEWYPTFEAEMTTFPRSSHDDQVAAMAVLGLALDKMVEAPTSKELMDEEWDFDFKSSIMGGSITDGRSITTGY